MEREKRRNSEEADNTGGKGLTVIAVKVNYVDGTAVADYVRDRDDEEER
jgi:hypothetical protein